MLRCLACLASLVAIAACSSPATPRGFCEAQRRAECHMAFSCCTAAERDVAFNGVFASVVGFADENECTAKRTTALCTPLQAEDDSLNQKKITWDAKAAQACIDTLNKAVDKCDAQGFFVDAFHGCDENFLLAGTVGKDGACNTSVECKNDAQCVTADNVVTIAGKCGDARAAIGEACDTLQCTLNAFCDPSSTKCAALKTNGTGCATDGECQSKHCIDGKCGDDVTEQICAKKQ